MTNDTIPEMIATARRLRIPVHLAPGPRLVVRPVRYPSDEHERVRGALLAKSDEVLAYLLASRPDATQTVPETSQRGPSVIARRPNGRSSRPATKNQPQSSVMPALLCEIYPMPDLSAEDGYNRHRHRDLPCMGDDALKREVRAVTLRLDHERDRWDRHWLRERQQRVLRTLRERMGSHESR